MTLYPEVQAKIHQEVDSVTQDYSEIEDPSKVFPYVSFVIKEILRHRLVASTLLVTNHEDVILHDHLIPKGSEINLLVRIASFQACPTPQPLAFNPDRWNPALVDEQTLIKQNATSLGFGFGPRICPGKNLAISELIWFTVLAAAPFKFSKLDLPIGHEVVTEEFKFTMKPANLHIRIEPLKKK